MIKMEISNIAIVGSGFTGTQIAARTIMYDFKIKMYDVNEESLLKTEKEISGLLKRRNLYEEKSKFISYHTDLFKALENADLIIEAVPEKIELKREAFSKIDELAPPHAIIGTNSSSFPVSKIESVVKRKDKVLNLHFYPPIPTRPMVDIMKGTETSDETFEAGKKWIERIECYPLVVKRECLGFVFNRVWHTVKKECLKIWDGGYADIETVDKAWQIFTGMPMGPFQLMDGVGLDVILDVENSYYNESGNESDKPPKKLKELVEQGDLGLKSGKGFYTYRRKRKK
jgi:3-hydroxybutyryl-CoA dehydrogenase